MGLLSFQRKIGTILHAICGKLTVFFSSYDPTFPSVPPYDLAFQPKRKLSLRNKRQQGYLLEKYHNFILNIVKLVAI